ncbi:alpha/beta fold hydrolase, partial [Corynebacterium macclintockiae]
MTSSFALLLHGGMHGAWCWERVIPHLRHRTIAIDLPGRPGAGKQPPTLDGFAETVLLQLGAGAKKAPFLLCDQRYVPVLSGRLEYPANNHCIRIRV